MRKRELGGTDEDVPDPSPSYLPEAPIGFRWETDVEIKDRLASVLAERILAAVQKCGWTAPKLKGMP